METIISMIRFLILAVVVRVKGLWETGCVIWRYFRVKKFAGAWSWLKLSYLLENPYRCSRRFVRTRDQYKSVVYGETPLTTLEQIMASAEVGTGDHIFELGSGAGFSSLWLNTILGCRVTAIDIIPVFCWRLMRVIRRFNLSGINVHCEDYTKTDFQGATVVYLYDPGLDDRVIAVLAEKLAGLPSGTKIISISYPLSDFSEWGSFKQVKKIGVDFDWGEAEVFIQTVV
ncbi:class I SAM-dependent methyltransferase [Endozoicomonas sp. Mp262]|uniref:SAM-dependent methyltransferase n=1 Tax=Endozoicomonas sp. Mp262 TaxID=2919499 RepID=UPI0021DF4491